MAPVIKRANPKRNSSSILLITLGKSESLSTHVAIVETETLRSTDPLVSSRWPERTRASDIIVVSSAHRLGCRYTLKSIMSPDDRTDELLKISDRIEGGDSKKLTKSRLTSPGDGKVSILIGVVVMLVLSIIIGYYLTMTIVLRYNTTNNRNKMYQALLMGFWKALIELLMVGFIMRDWRSAYTYLVLILTLT